MEGFDKTITPDKNTWKLRVCVCVYDVSFVKDCADEKKTYVLTVPDLTPRHSMAENEGLGLYRSAKVLVLKSD